MKLKYFGTDGIRGPYGGPALNDEIAFRAGKAAVRVAREKLFTRSPQIVVGRDTRSSGVALLKAFAAGVVSEGGKLIDLGVAPTPCVAFAARNSEAIFGCVLTASHNTTADNGIKFFGASGVKLSEEIEFALDDMIDQVATGTFDRSSDPLRLNGKALRDLYRQAVVGAFPLGLLAGKRVALDCSNGAMSEIAPAVFRELGAIVDVVADSPDGSNINAGVGSEHPESLGALYEDSEYDFGVAFDGDGDRLVLFDENGQRVKGEAVLAVLAIDAKHAGQLPGDMLVTTVQSNLGLDSALKEYGIKTQRTDVGDKHIARLMLQAGYALGGEESGHVVVGRFAITGDGLVASIALAEVLVKSNSPVSKLASVYSAFPQQSKALKVAAKPAIEECAALSACIEKLDSELGEDGRLLVRYSGTEPKIRVLVEARSEEEVAATMAELLAAVEKDLELV